MVTGQAAPLQHLLDIWDGEVVAPFCLESVVVESELSIAATMTERLAAATRADLGDVPRSLATLSTLTPEEVLHLARRFGWTLKTLTDWHPQEDRSGLRIEAALASAAAWNVSGNFWEAVRSHLQGCRLTIAALEIMLRSRSAQAHIPNDTPIWEREHLNAMHEAERARNWAELGERARAFQRLPSPDLGARQATLALSLLNWPHLVRLAGRCESWLDGHLLMAPLPLSEALRLATASENGYIRFAALDRIAYREARALLVHEETALRDLLIILARDVEEWPHWLVMCNRYPVRHPHMQIAFGKALARSNGPALQAYIDSISLSTSDTEIRANVTHCLSTFRERAGADRRRALWRVAFERWQNWNFAKSEGQNLTTLARSALDYGVVGWLVEGEPQKSLAEIERSFEDDLRTSEMQWHASVSSAISDFLRLLSRFQVLAHAASRSADDADWLPVSPVMFPAAAANSFTQAKYGWSNHEPST